MLKPYFEEAFTYAYGEIPYYSKLRHLLKVELHKLNEVPCNDLFGQKVLINNNKGKHHSNSVARREDEHTFYDSSETVSIAYKASKYLNFTNINKSILTM